MKYGLYREWCMAVPWCIPYSGLCVVSRRPVVAEWNERKVLHCDNGPAVAFRDGFRVWCIDGIRVDEQIVMRPESQTVKQIDGEQNGDVRSIRIERFGWPRYLKETGSKCREHRVNDVTGTDEALYQTPRGEQRLVVGCSTGRMFALGVPASVETCEQAQRWLAGDKKFNVIAAT